MMHEKSINESEIVSGIIGWDLSCCVSYKQWEEKMQCRKQLPHIIVNN